MNAGERFPLNRNRAGNSALKVAAGDGIQGGKSRDSGWQVVDEVRAAWLALE
jgi:hypothetical protein